MQSILSKTGLVEIQCFVQFILQYNPWLASIRSIVDVFKIVSLYLLIKLINRLHGMKLTMHDTSNRDKRYEINYIDINSLLFGSRVVP